MNQIQTTPSSLHLLDITDKLGKLLGIAATCLLILSTAYDFSFLYSLGLSFEDVPSTLADHARSAIVWAPRACVYLLIILTYEMLMRRVEGGLSEEELIQSSRTPRFIRAFRESPKFMYGVLVVFLIFTETLFTTSNLGFFIAAMCVWGTLSLAVVTHPRMGEKFTATSGRLFIMLPLLVMWVGTMGYVRGESMLNSLTPQWAIEVKVGSIVEKRQIHGLRRFSTAVILVSIDHRVSVVANENIVSVEIIRSPNADIPRVCRWFGFMCVNEKSVR